MVNAHIESLNWQCKQLNRKIHREETRPLPDESLLHTLKWKRLKLKDEIQILKNKF